MRLIAFYCDVLMQSGHFVLLVYDAYLWRENLATNLYGVLFEIFSVFSVFVNA